ncbi:MAG: sodium ion-translocating decarboxylase subunit beta [Clostridiales bacterium]|nr:sodium ion-translocating decarboxylase subunit beta [Clostridiales bacterium]
MKKLIYFLGCILVGAGLVLGALSLSFWHKKAVAVSIIGGADGPTSVFLAGKIGGNVTAGLGIVAVVCLMAAGIVWFFWKKHNKQ